MKKYTLKWVAASLLLVLGAGAAQAQTLYRSVGPDGRVTFSDVPPPASKSKAAPTGTGAPASASSPLPYELQQVVNRYPVTLYTGDACGPCGSGRILLTSRGIPFSERTVNTAEDVAALQRLSGDTSLPFLTVGAQQIKGYSDAEWTQYLDAAGYPKTSKLPSGYSAAAATPLVAVQRPAANAPATPGTGASAPVVETVNTRQRPSAPPSEPAVNPNPAGIRF
ncbi:MAG: glutaredoxin family protein [Burkholderiaceae bacterium]|jgi:glutaredoxin|nr:glutaredoxin family protein [Burkholderiaceae bacterium]